MSNNWVAVNLHLTKRGPDSKGYGLQSERYRIAPDSPLDLGQLLRRVALYIAEFYVTVIPEEQVSDEELERQVHAVGEAMMHWTLANPQNVGEPDIPGPTLPEKEADDD